MIYEYLYIFSADLPRYEAEGWELCGSMKSEKYQGGHLDTMIVKREVGGKNKGWPGYVCLPDGQRRRL